MDMLVHADNEAGDDTGGQNRIVIFKGRDTGEFQIGRFILGQKVRDEESLIRLNVIAEFKLFHHIHDKETFAAWIFRQVENLIEHGYSEHAFVLEQSM